MSRPKTRGMSMARSAELVERMLQEHADAYLVITINPDGVPMVIGRATNPAYCIALNTILGNVYANGGIACTPNNSDASQRDATDG